MKCLSVLLALAALSLPNWAAAEESARVIVRFKPAADSVRAKAMSARMDAVTAADIAQTRATALGLRTGLSSRAALGLRARLNLDNRTHVMTATGLSSDELVRTLQADSEVEIVVVDQRRRRTLVPNDSLYAGNGGVAPTSGAGSANGQWYLKAPTSVLVSSINAPSAWDITTGANSVVVAVLDTGIRFDHPDLAGQFALNTSSSTGRGGYDMIGLNTASALATANDGNLSDDDPSDPGDWVTSADISGGALGSGCTSSDVGNSSWHGTRVSGLIAAASNNGQGIAGVAWGVKLLPVRVLGKCGGYDSDIMAGMKWAAGIAVAGLPANPNPAKVLNMSLGGTGTCGTTGTGALYRDTINQVIAAGATIVAAAGNSEGQAVGIPGNCPGVIAVAALRHVGSKVGFSSVGPEVAISAPGGNCINTASNQPCLYPMLSTYNSGTQGPVLNDASYTNNGASVGTSFSAPIVSGTVALMLSARPGMTSSEVLSVLKSTARPFVTTGGSAGISQCVAPSTTAVQDECYCTTATCGAGMLDAGRAVAAVQTANSATVQISTAPSTAVAGQSVTLTASVTNLPTGRSIAAYSWSLVTNGGIVSGFSTVTTGASVSLTPTGAGSFSVRVQATDDQGLIYSSTASVSVSGLAQTITFTAPANPVAASTATLAATSSSGLAVSYTASPSSVCTVSGSTLTLLTAGVCTVTATQAGNSTYSAATPVARSFTVAAASQSIVFASLTSQALGSTTAPLVATASSGLTVSFASQTPSVCTVNGTALGLVALGTCTVTASQAGNATYAAASPLSQSFSVVARSQTITFPTIAGQTLGATPPALTATASSGLPVSFASSTTAVCTVSGSALTLVAVGTCTITATQAGDSSYAPANDISQSFAVSAAAVLPPVTTTTTSSGGGGAFSGLWLLLLGGAGLALRRRPVPMVRMV